MRSPVQILRRLVHVLRADGPTELVRRIYRRVVPPSASRHPFDLHHKVDTAGVVQASDLITGHDNDRHARAYWGVAPSLFRGALAHWERSLADTPLATADYTFVDLGSGKGRALLLASEFPFERIVGVELSPVLTSIAHRNIVRWLQTPRKCNRIEAIHGDALAFMLPESPVLLYLYNPFDAVVTQGLADRLESLAPSRSEPIDILYLRPDYASSFEAVPGIQTLYKDYVAFSPEDTAVDPGYTRRHEVYLYRLPGHSAGADR